MRYAVVGHHCRQYALMKTDDHMQKAGAATATFERNLETLIFESFAAGATIDGTWNVRSLSPAVPDWTVEITRHSTSVANEDETPPRAD